MNRKSKRYAAGGEADETAKKEVFKRSADPDFESNREVKRGESDAADKPKKQVLLKKSLKSLVLACAIT